MLKQYIFIALHFSHSLHSLHSLYSFHRELPIAIGIMRTRKMIKMLSIQSKLHCTQERPEYNQSTLKFVSRNVLFGDTIQSILAIENRPECNFQLRDGSMNLAKFCKMILATTKDPLIRYSLEYAVAPLLRFRHTLFLSANAKEHRASWHYCKFFNN